MVKKKKNDASSTLLERKKRKKKKERKVFKKRRREKIGRLAQQTINDGSFAEGKSVSYLIFPISASLSFKLDIKKKFMSYLALHSYCIQKENKSDRKSVV